MRTNVSYFPRKMDKPLKQRVVAIKGAGEMATGIAYRLFQANLKHLFMMEIENPLAVRRRVSFCEAVHDDAIIVEGVMGKRVVSANQASSCWDTGCIPIIVDPSWKSIHAFQPDIVVDAILAKRNLGTARAEAELVIGLGPGFEGGNDVHVVVETNRGHHLGRIIRNGQAEPNTGIPGNIAGYTAQRVLRAPCAGIFKTSVSLGERVKKNDVIGFVGDQPVIAEIDGVLRGVIRDNTWVKNRLKIGDIDPRGKQEYCTTISEKARAIGGSVLEAILAHFNN